MNQKNYINNDADDNSIKPSNTSTLQIPFVRRDRHHSETDNLYDYSINLNNLNDNSQINQLMKLGGSAPQTSLFFDDNFNDFSSKYQTNYTENYSKSYINDGEKSPIIYSDYSASDMSDDDEKSSLASFKKGGSSFLKFSLTKKEKTPKLQDLTNEKNFHSTKTKSNFLQLPKPSSLFSSSTGNIDATNQSNGKRSRKAKEKSLVRKRTRCYSMDERRHNYQSKREKELDSPFSFDNLAYKENNSNLSDISEPLSSSEKSNENLKNLQHNDEEVSKKKLPIILINNQQPEYRVKFDLNTNEEDEKNEDQDYLIQDGFKTSSNRMDVELGSNESDEDLSDKNHSTTIEFTTKLASDLSKPEIDSESLVSFMIQVFFPLLVCGLGSLIAGLLLEKIESYDVFKEVKELYIAVPCLMGLKGNLEMTMASRLSTAANSGILEHLPQILSIIKSNICLLQTQATVVSLLASFIGIIDSQMNGRDINIHEIFLLITSNVVTANVCCTMLSALMIGIILFCKHQSINPDNVATPIASSLGDVSTVFLLGYISSYLYESIESEIYWLSPLILTIVLIITPFSMVVAFKNKHTKKVLKGGWLPIICSMIISSAAGVILNKVINMFSGFALFQPIVNGVGGNLAAIQASRIGTYLHKTTNLGCLPVKELSTIDSQLMESCGKLAECKNSESNFSEVANYIQLDERLDDFKDVDLNDNENCNLKENINSETRLTDESTVLNHSVNHSMKSSIDYSSGNQKIDCFNQASYRTRKVLRTRRKKLKNYLKVIFSSGSIHQKTARLLILITLPMHVLYFYLIRLIVNHKIFGSFPFFFIFFYLMVNFAQMTGLLYLTKMLVYFLWKQKLDPDTWATPILTAIGDLTGTFFLASIFYIFVPI